MIKIVTWVSLALSILGVVADLTQSGGGGDDAAEVAMAAKVLMGSDPVPSDTVPDTPVRR